MQARPRRPPGCAGCGVHISPMGKPQSGTSACSIGKHVPDVSARCGQQRVSPGRAVWGSAELAQLTTTMFAQVCRLVLLGQDHVASTSRCSHTRPRFVGMNLQGCPSALPPAKDDIVGVKGDSGRCGDGLRGLMLGVNGLIGYMTKLLARRHGYSASPGRAIHENGRNYQ